MEPLFHERVSQMLIILYFDKLTRSVGPVDYIILQIELFYYAHDPPNAWIAIAKKSQQWDRS